MTKAKTGFVRNGLVIFQFVIAIVMVISTLVVFTQLRYTQHRDLGYDKENILIIGNTGTLAAGAESFRQEIAALPQVKDATSSTGIFTKASFGDFTFRRPPKPIIQLPRTSVYNPISSMIILSLHLT